MRGGKPLPLLEERRGRMILNSDTLLAMCALTTLVGLVLMAVGVTGIRKRPTEGLMLTIIGEILVIVGFLASRYAE